MYHHTTALTIIGVEKLRAQFEGLKERYLHITQELKDKTQSHNILADKSIEKEIILSDMMKVEMILSNATVLGEHAPPLQAEQGTKVTYIQNDTGEKRIVTLVDPLETDPLEGYISVQSPVGSMLLGRKVGDSVTITTPRGNLSLTISALE
jgi:transcription elongation factor GreA